MRNLLNTFYKRLREKYEVDDIPKYKEEVEKHREKMKNAPKCSEHSDMHKYGEE